MIRITELRLPLDHTKEQLKEALQRCLPVPIRCYHIIRKAYDARKRGYIQFVYTIDCEVENEEFCFETKLGKNVKKSLERKYNFVVQPSKGETISRRQDYQRPIIVGAGPCGLMSGLILAQMGLRPLILERGKPVRERAKDTFNFWRHSQFNPESNVQYGEGGAGTFSDGKLHTQISDPNFYGYKVLTEFVKAGAPEEILFISKPHVGTFRLVSIVEHIRNEIETLGGSYQFNACVKSLIMDQDRQVKGIRLSNGQEIETRHVILATGHSARDVMIGLADQEVFIEAKPFSVGVRIEHPQSLIDMARFGSQAGHKLLGAADYKLIHHTQSQRGVYSFCMCPGGSVIAAASEPGGVVTNGMSQYSRAERNANAAIVVSVAPGRDYQNYALAGIDFQRDLEQKAFEIAGRNYKAPAQRLEDFLHDRATKRYGDVVPSYKPGTEPINLTTILPKFIVQSIKEALPAFDRKLKGFNFADAVMTGVETRTSSPIRITRNDKYHSVNTPGLYPSGEGAGYAGGIMSAAIDGIKVAEAVAQDLTK